MEPAEKHTQDERPKENRLLRFIRRTEEVFFGIVLFAIIILGLMPILLRTFSSTGVTWTEPLSRQLVLWLALFGAGAATQDNKHITVDIISHVLSSHWKARIAACTSFLSAGICGLLTWISIKFVIDEREYAGPSAIFSSIPEWMFELVLPIGFFILTVRLLIAGAIQFHSGFKRESE